MAVLSERMKNFTGLVSSADVIFTDYTCKAIDYDAMVKMWKYLVDCGCSAIMPTEEPQCLSRDERIKLVDLLVETLKGTDCIPMDYVWSDSTAEAIDQALTAKAHGAEAVLISPPNVPGYQGNKGPHFLEHFKEFGKKTDMPFILMGGDGLYGNNHMEIDAYVEIIKEVENCWACKVTATNIDTYVEYLKAIKAVRPECRVLKAGSFNTATIYKEGGDGNLSGQLSMAKYDCEIHRLCKEGKFDEAQKVDDESTPLGILPYTYDISAKPVPFFETNFKAMSWMLGLIDIPAMRRPYVPSPMERLITIRDQLVKMGLEVKHDPAEWVISEI